MTFHESIVYLVIVPFPANNVAVLLQKLMPETSIQKKIRVSRNFVGIIFYTRKVLLTSHYEKRLFEYASQPRVAGSDIRLLSYLWS